MQAQERPVFRQDLVAEAIEEQGAKYIDVMDPDSGNVFRFFEVEYSIACAMDGQRDVAGIVKWAQEELGLTPSPKEVQSVIATLADLRFIETGATKLSDVPEAKVAARSNANAFDDYGEATTVGASPMADDELARGIVVGTAARSAAPLDVELGHAGSSTPAASSGRDQAMPKADFDLGAPGAGAASAKPPRAPVDDIALGAPGAREAAKPAAKAPAAASDLSMDLSEHLAVKPSDVKEAVRASKVMTAVEVPKELQDELDRPAAKAAEKPAEKAAAKAAEKPAEKAAEKAAKKPAEKAVAKAAEKPAEKAVAKAAEKPAEKAAEKAAKKPAGDKQPVAPPAPQQRVNPVLVILLILAAVGAGAFFFWKFVLAKPEAAETSTQKTAPPPKPVPPPPTEATAKVALETPPAQDVKSPVGALETVEATDKDVKNGDVLATLVGAKALTTELANLQKDVDKGATAIEAAQKELSDAQQKENNQAGVTAAQAKLDRVKKPIDDKKATIAKKQADLDKLTIKAWTDGKLSITAKVGQKVAADEVIAKITRATVPVATFKIPPTTKIGADGNVSITAGDKTIVCTVSDAQTESIKVTCPADAGLADGADVKFKFPK